MRSRREPEKAGPFLLLTTPLHMHYGPASNMSDLHNNVCLLHYIRYAEQLMRGVDLETQPESFLRFTRDTSEWLKKNFVSLRGKNTADNFQEYLRMDRLRSGKSSVEYDAYAAAVCLRRRVSEKRGSWQ